MGLPKDFQYLASLNSEAFIWRCYATTHPPRLPQTWLREDNH